jgi:hypothetical protein
LWDKFLDYDAKQMAVSVKTVVTDEKLKKSWGGQLYQIVFRLKSPGPTASYRFVLHPGAAR